MNKKKILHPFDLDLSSLAILRTEFLKAESENTKQGMSIDVGTQISKK